MREGETHEVRGVGVGTEGGGLHQETSIQLKGSVDARCMYLYFVVSWLLESEGTVFDIRRVGMPNFIGFQAT